MKVTFRWIPLALALVLGGTATACDDDATGPRIPEDVSFDASLGVDLDAMTRLSSGVYVQTLDAGSGLPLADGSTVVLDYAVWLPNGNEVDSGTDVTFTVAPGALIEGFRIGVLGMQPDERRLIVIPSELAYGARGNRGIPPHSVLVFEVTRKDSPGPV